MIGNLLGILLSLMPGNTTLPHSSVSFSWHCGETSWGEGPTVENDLFKGRIDVTCQYEAVGGGGLKQLANHFVDAIKTGATTIHQGPDSLQYDHLPATYFDITRETTHDGNHLSERSDVYIATDETSRWLFANISKEIHGTGTASYLKKQDDKKEVSPLGDKQYKVDAKVWFQIARPSFLPKPLFQSQAQQQIEAEVRAEEASFVTELAENT